MDTIKYIGPAGTRLIRETEWEAIGVSKQDTTVWNSANLWTVPASDLNQAARDALKSDPFFIFSGAGARVEQEVEIDLDLAAEAEKLANENSSDATPDPDTKKR